MNVFRRIGRAAKRGTGMRLNAADVSEVWAAVADIAYRAAGPSVEKGPFPTRDGDRDAFVISSEKGTYFTRKRDKGRL
jgi:hypothetical protein